MKPSIQRSIAMLFILLPVLAISGQAIFLADQKLQIPVQQVVITGYDPRDALMGHYLNFRYDWDNAASQKPHLPYLPANGRFYIPEKNSLALEQALRDRAKQCKIAYQIIAHEVRPVDLLIDNKPWREAIQN